jgi:hypothetical protein
LNPTPGTEPPELENLTEALQRHAGVQQAQSFESENLTAYAVAGLADKRGDFGCSAGGERVARIILQDQDQQGVANSVTICANGTDLSRNLVE